MINQTWDYPGMTSCAEELDRLCERSNTNKAAMDDAIELLSVGVQAEVGKAFVAAYSEHMASIQLFAQILKEEADLIRSNSNTMQAEDARIAAEVRARFNV